MGPPPALTAPSLRCGTCQFPAPMGGAGTLSRLAGVVRQSAHGSPRVPFFIQRPEVEPEICFSTKMELGLVVHSADLFTGDHILNLAADDEEYRRLSIANLQRVINVARRMKPWFTRAERVSIVASLGGFSRNAPLPQ